MRQWRTFGAPGGTRAGPRGLWPRRRSGRREVRRVAERLSTVTEAAPSQSRKRRAAQAGRAARRAFDGGGSPEGRSAHRHSAHRTVQPSAKREPPGPRKFFVRAGRRPCLFPGRYLAGASPSAGAAGFPFHPNDTAPGFFRRGTSFFLSRGTPSGFSRRCHPNCGDDATAPGFCAARFFFVLVVAGRRISAGGSIPAGPASSFPAARSGFIREAAAPGSGRRRLPPFPPRP